MTLQGENTSATFASIAVHAILNWTLIHLNMSIHLPLHLLVMKDKTTLTANICTYLQIFTKDENTDGEKSKLVPNIQSSRQGGSSERKER